MPATVDAFWEASVHMLDALLASDLADLATLREIDVEALLSTTGAALMDSAAEMPAENEEMVSFAERVARVGADRGRTPQRRGRPGGGAAHGPG